jgi:hypothetical protein
MWNRMIAFGDCAASVYDDAWAPILSACERYDRDLDTLSQGAIVAENFTDDPYPIVPTSVPFAGSIDNIAGRFAEYAARDVAHISVIPHPWNEQGLGKLSTVLEWPRA